MTNKDELKKRLNSYSKDEIIDVILISTGATAFVITRLEALYGVKTDPKPKQTNKPKKEA